MSGAREKLEGILPALVTPVHEDETVNTRELEKLVDRVYAGNVDGVYLCGSTGEGMVLPRAERQKIVETVMSHSPRSKRVVVHVGAWSFAESRELARHAERAGASAISALPPAGVNFEELLDFYKALADTTVLPLIAYYFPAASGPVLTQSQLEELCAVPGIAGLKFTDYDLYTLSVLVRAGHWMFNGRDEILAAGLLMGASGGIGSFYNLMPGWFAEVYRYAREGRWAESRTIQDRINDVMRVVLRYPFLSALKQVMTWEGIQCGPALRPRGVLTAYQAAELRAALEPLLTLHEA